MAQKSPQQLRDAWTASDGPGKTLKKLYSDGLQQYSDWLGDVFYPAFGINDFGLAQPADLPADASIEELDYYIAAKDLASKLNNLNQQVFDIERGEESVTLASGDWPGSNLSIYDYAYYRGVVVPVFVGIVEDLKVIQENILISVPEGLSDAFSFGQSPPDNLPELIEKVIDAAEIFLAIFPDVGISFKKDMSLPTSTSGLGPTPIFSDANLESSLSFSTSQTHYIGFLLNSEKSNGNRGNSYLPVRLAPNVQGDNSPPESTRGWQDPDYRLIDNNGNIFESATKIDNGIEIPLGLEITVLEIVQSETGVWVGFVSDDPRVLVTEGSPIATELADAWNNITNQQTRVLYTKSHFIRIKESAISNNPDPYISQLTKFATTGEEPTSQALRIEGSQPVDPTGMNWVNSLRANDVRLEYYSFYDYNLKVLGEDSPDQLFFNGDTILAAPTLRYSEGYFYFIAGEAPRKSEAELINEDSADVEASKANAGAVSFETIKREAWNSLLTYLGKNMQGGNSILYERLYENYFVLAASKLNTNSVNPNNQKALFAIRSQYIDSLPESRSSLNDFFEEDSPFINGKSYSTSMKVKDIQKRVDDLVGDLKTIKSKSSENTIHNDNGTSYDFDIQIEALEKLPTLIDDFLRRQAYPNSSKRSFIYEMAGEGINTPSDHVIQIGVKDNSEVGGNVRQTISYILFAPDVTKVKSSTLRGFGVGDANLYYFDPYLKGEDISEGTTRSAVPLNIGINLLRSKMDGSYYSRALHLLMSYASIRPKLQKAKLDIQNDEWMEYLSQFLVPPVKIYLSKLPDPFIEEEQIDCQELIDQINKAGPNSTREDRLVQEKLYNNPKCLEQYYNKFKKDTYAGSPDLSKKELELKADSFSSGKEGMSAETSEYLRILYQTFFNVLDVDAIIAMIMACLSKKLGIEFTAEAICEAAIIELIKNLGPSPIEQAMLANALLSPDSAASQNFLAVYQGAPPFVEPGSPAEDKFKQEMSDQGLLVIDSQFDNAPIASHMAMSNKPSGIVKLVRELEKGGVVVDLIPGRRPESNEGIQVPFGSGLGNLIAGAVGESGETFYSERYTQKEIQQQKNILKERGYTDTETRALLVETGYLDVDPVYYEGLLGGNDSNSPADKFVNQLRSQQFSGAVNISAAEDFRAVAKDAQKWLNYMKGVLGLQGLCELLVGDILDGLKELISDPGAFFSGGAEGWWDDFVEKLKKQFTPPPMTFKFPDNLMTDSHMGDYEKQLAKMLITMIATIAGQIASMYIKDALEKCLEEDDDQGPGGRPQGSPPDIPIPSIERANLPNVNGLPGADLVAWLKDLIDNLNTAQLCALLQGTATEQTLRGCLARTKSNWRNVYLRGIDTVYEIRVIFEQLGESLDLDICNIDQSPLPLTLISNICDAFYDRDSRCEQLKLGGLTEEECQKQIDRELDDLRNKVIGLTSTSLFNLSPLSNNLPPICGEGGSFVVPPGVRDTMDRITNNMLTALKGSLMIDMNAMKFFSTPPRALLAMSDPGELANIHASFSEAIKNPYKKRCLAMVVDYSYLDQRLGDKPNCYERYPFVYDKFVHAGNFSTWRAREIGDSEPGIPLYDLTYAQTQLAKEAAGEQYDELKRIAEEEYLDENENQIVINSLKSRRDTEQDKFRKDNDKARAAVGDAKKKWNRIKDETFRRVAPKIAALTFLIEFLEGSDYVSSLYEEHIDVTNAGNRSSPAQLSSLLGQHINTGEFWQLLSAIQHAQGAPFILPQVKMLTDWETGVTHVVLGKDNEDIENWIPPVTFLVELLAILDIAYETVQQLAKDSAYPSQTIEDLESIEKSKILADFALELGQDDLFILSDEDFKEDIVNRWNRSIGIKRDNFFDREDPIPVNVATMLSNASSYNSQKSNFNNFISDDERISSTINSYIENQIANLDESLYAASNSELPTYLSEKIMNTFEEEQKPTFLDTLVVDYDQLLRPVGPKGGLLVGDKNLGSSTGHSFIGNIHGGNYRDRRLRRSYTLDTKLKDIHPDPEKWYYMLRSYTGCMMDGKAGRWSRTLPEFMSNDAFVDTFDPDNFSSFVERVKEDADEAPIVLVGTSEFSWFYWLSISPGLRKIIARALEIKSTSDIDIVNEGEDDEEARIVDLRYQGKNHHVAMAFMDFTLGEAIGFEHDRIKKIFPNITPAIFSTAEVVFGSTVYLESAVIKRIHSLSESDKASGDILHQSYQPGSAGDGTYAGHKAQYYPHFIVYDKYFRDPDSIYNKSDQEVIDYFSGDRDLVNKELYDFLSYKFPLTLGAGDSPLQMGSRVALIEDSLNLENEDNFNPNILKYDLPFTELTPKGAPGIDTNQILQEITTLFSSADGTSQANEIANNISAQKLNKDLVYQNVASVNLDPITSNLDMVKDMSRMIKSIIRNLPNNKTFPPNVIPGDNGLDNVAYDIDYLKDQLLDGGTAKTILKSYSEIAPYLASNLGQAGFLIEDDQKALSGIDRTALPENGAGYLEPFNFKAQTFGNFLMRKFTENFLEYYEPENIPASQAQFVEDNQEPFFRILKTILTTYGYSSLQYAYSTQMFTKLKHSRLHMRANMKKIWDKILKSPITSDVDPRCQDLFDQLSAPSTRDIENVETDFFDLAKVKPMIIRFYEKSLCYDVYEKNNEEDNAARVALLEGMVLLVSKVYTLEMCIASLIAWDSFNFEDVIKDKIFTSIIIDNISKDFDLEFINFFANDILKKDLSLSAETQAKIRSEQSSLEYLISREAENISSVVSSLFNNSRPLSTDLNLNILRNSDPDFIDEAKKRFGDQVSDENLLALTSLFENYDIEIVHDVRFDNNIYTMNYSDGHHRHFLKDSYFIEDPINMPNDIFGHFNQSNINNKNYLHSLPMTYHESFGGFFGSSPYETDYDKDYGDNDSQYYSFANWKIDTKISEDPVNAPGLFDYFNNTIDYAKNVDGLLGSDALSHENLPENTFGNNMNAKLGNVLFQPYVKIEDWLPGDVGRDKFIVDIYSEYEDNNEPCDTAEIVGTVNINDFLGVIQELIEAGREESGNIMGAYIYGNVALSAWSYYFEHIFISRIKEYTVTENGLSYKPLLYLYRKYGYKPFFKKVSFGMRMMYCTSYPIMQSDRLNFENFMKNAFFNPDITALDAGSLKKAKCLYGQRPYVLTKSTGPRVEGQIHGLKTSTTILGELQIPLYNYEEEIKVIDAEGTNNIAMFTVGESDAYSINKLSNFIEPIKQINQQGLFDYLASNPPGAAAQALRLTDNHNQFFYNNLADRYLKNIKKSDEFKLMFEQLFPMPTYMSLASMVAADGLSKFISEPTIVLEETKETLQMIIQNLINSTDYKHVPDPVANFLQDFALRNEGGTTGKDKDLTKELLKIIFRTPLMILKGFVEVTDPAIIIAKLIIDISNTIVFTTLGAIQTGIRIAKQNIDAGIQAGEQSLMMIEMNLSTSIAPAKAAAQSLPTVPSDEGPIKLSEYVVIDVEAGDPIVDEDSGETLWKETKFYLRPLPQSALDNMDEGQLESWNGFKDQFEAMKDLVKDYAKAKSTLNELKAAKEALEKELEEKVKEAEKIMKDVFKSPFLLPGLWAALIPSMIPYMGGIIPPPFPGGPPSTIPGMIYLALLLIDAIEEKTHKDLSKLGEEPNCEDEL